MAHDIEIVFVTSYVSQVQVRSQNPFTGEIGTDEHLPQEVDNTTAAARKRGLRRIPKRSDMRQCASSGNKLLLTFNDFVRGEVFNDSVFQADLRGRNYDQKRSFHALSLMRLARARVTESLNI